MLHVESGYASLRRQYIAVFNQWRIVRVLSGQPRNKYRRAMPASRVEKSPRRAVGTESDSMTEVLPVKLEQTRYRGARARTTAVVARPRGDWAARSRACVAAAVCGS
eukprot:2852938-Pleurochrysis_carterae.AAC.1